MSSLTRRSFLRAGALGLASCRRGRNAHAALVPGRLVGDALEIARHLRSSALELLEVESIQSAVSRMRVRSSAMTFHAKWKPMGVLGSEVQDGFDGNNAPRCEIAAWETNTWLHGAARAERHHVAPVVLRAFHRPVACDRACARVPRLPFDAVPTFASYNDHLVLGALTWWIDPAEHPTRFEGENGLWDPARWARSSRYRASVSDLCVWLRLVDHGDANYDANFLLELPTRERVFSIDNGRSLDGVSFYTDDADPAWQPFARPGPHTMITPTVPASTLRALESHAFSRDALHRALRVVTAVDLHTGLTHSDLDTRVALASQLEWTGRGVALGVHRGTPWVALGIGAPGIDALAHRARSLALELRPRATSEG